MVGATYGGMGVNVIVATKTTIATNAARRLTPECDSLNPIQALVSVHHASEFVMFLDTNLGLPRQCRERGWVA